MIRHSGVASKLEAYTSCLGFLCRNPPAGYWLLEAGSQLHPYLPEPTLTGSKKCASVSRKSAVMRNFVSELLKSSSMTLKE